VRRIILSAEGTVSPAQLITEKTMTPVAAM
jgi:hypothetical protein